MFSSVNIKFNGNCAEAFDFYRSVFGGDFLDKQLFSAVPESAGFTVPEADKNKVMHVVLKVGDATIMGSDALSAFPPAKVGDNVSIFVAADSIEDGQRIFNELAAGGVVIMPFAEAFWATRYGILVDKFGTNWMIAVMKH